MGPKIFISFAKEDVRYRDLLVGQAKQEPTPFEFRDMSLQEPFDHKWKTRCSARIMECHGFIALLSRNTWRADGARWEMKCAAHHGLPMLGIHIHKQNRGAIPPEMRGRRVVTWRWSSIATFIQTVDRKRSWLSRLLD